MTEGYNEKLWLCHFYTNTNTPQQRDSGRGREQLLVPIFYRRQWTAAEGKSWGSWMGFSLQDQVSSPPNGSFCNTWMWLGEQAGQDSLSHHAAAPASSKAQRLNSWPLILRLAAPAEPGSVPDVKGGWLQVFSLSVPSLPWIQS